MSNSEKVVLTTDEKSCTSRPRRSVYGKRMSMRIVRARRYRSMDPQACTCGDCRDWIFPPDEPSEPDGECYRAAKRKRLSRGTGAHSAGAQ